jgi:3-oxoacyl-[acyl-carrier protein] reductase
VGVLDAKTALVTGGSRGIGRAIVRRLVDDGASVVFSYQRDEAAAAEVVRESAERAFAVRADQGDLGAVERLFGEAEQRLGGLDILVVNAAINPVKSILDTTEDDFDRVMAVNAKGPFFAIRHAASRLRDDGRIICVSTLNTRLPVPGIAMYAASKAALEQFAAVAAREVGPRGITVNVVSPGLTDTDLLRESNPPEALEQTVTFTALGRLGEPADIAAVVAFLAGPDARWITGDNLRATGGLIL